MRAYTLSQSGFIIYFRNGLGLSVRWSPLHYAEAKVRWKPNSSVAMQEATVSESADVCLVYNGEAYGDTIGWVTSDFLVSIMFYVSEIEFHLQDYEGEEALKIYFDGLSKRLEAER